MGTDQSARQDNCPASRLKIVILDVGGTTWDLCQGDTGWKVRSSVRTSNTAAADLIPSDFTNALVDQGPIARSRYLPSIEAGTKTVSYVVRRTSRL